MKQLTSQAGAESKAGKQTGQTVRRMNMRCATIFVVAVWGIPEAVDVAIVGDSR
jgi:hypothetical protein